MAANSQIEIPKMEQSEWNTNTSLDFNVEESMLEVLSSDLGILVWSDDAFAVSAS